MRKFSAVIAICLLALPAFDEAQACSFAAGYKIVEPQTYPHDADFTPPTPAVSIKALVRGFDDGNSGSCSDAGILMIVTEDRPHPEIAGYSFRVAEGIFPDTVFPDAVIAPIDIGDGVRGFGFIWLDLPPGQRKTQRIDATIEVRLVALSGAEGAPKLLHIIHEGG